MTSGPTAAAPAGAQLIIEEPEPVVQDRALPLFGHALLLDDAAFRVLRDHAHPFRRGLVLLLWLTLALVAALLLQLALGLLTTPRLDIVEQELYAKLITTEWYAGRAAEAGFAADFQAIYLALWAGLRLLGGYPSVAGTTSAVISKVVGLWGTWLIYGLLAHGAARWFGSRVRMGQFYGPLALAFAPLLLTLVLVWPGAEVARPMIFLALVATRYVAVKTVYGMGVGRSLTITATPYVIVLLVEVAVALLGVAYGFEQIPYLNQALRLLSYLPGR